MSCNKCGSLEGNSWWAIHYAKKVQEQLICFKCDSELHRSTYQHLRTSTQEGPFRTREEAEVCLVTRILQL
jgi:hypothetical protein